MPQTYDELPLRAAAGFVLARRRKGGLEYLALKSRRTGELGLPKGHGNQGESAEETARRETAEETGIVDIDIRRRFRRTLNYVVTRKGRRWHKQVVLFAAYTTADRIHLSAEHSNYAWLGLGSMMHAMPWLDLQKAVYRAALFLKDPTLFELDPATEAEAYAHLKSLPHANRKLRHHLRGGARLARLFAQALSEAGKRVHIEATAAGTVLHDVGRALGDHEDHQRAGVRHLRKTAFAPYSFACISHFTKGAGPAALRRAGLPPKLVASFRRMTDLRTMTWEERCAALADACMRGDEPVSPAKRFSDLRQRYDAPALIDLQEQRTEKLRRKIQAVIGVDPIELAKLD